MLNGWDDDGGYEDGCAACGGQLAHLGALGTREHYRCRVCGLDQSRDTDPMPIYDDECYEEG